MEGADTMSTDPLPNLSLRGEEFGKDQTKDGCRRPPDGTREIKVGCSRASSPTIRYEQPMLLPQLWQR